MKCHASDPQQYGEYPRFRLRAQLLRGSKGVFGLKVSGTLTTFGVAHNLFLGSEWVISYTHMYIYVYATDIGIDVYIHL